MEPIYTLTFKNDNWKNIKTDILSLKNSIKFINAFDDLISIIVYNNIMLYPHVIKNKDQMIMSVYNKNDKDINTILKELGYQGGFFESFG